MTCIASIFIGHLCGTHKGGGAGGGWGVDEMTHPVFVFQRRRGPDRHHYCLGCSASAAAQRRGSWHPRLRTQHETAAAAHGADRGKATGRRFPKLHVRPIHGAKKKILRLLSLQSQYVFLHRCIMDCLQSRVESDGKHLPERGCRLCQCDGAAKVPQKGQSETG